MDQLNETGHDEMLNCPKCGFQQPRDQYCAKCGVDMTKAAQSRKKVSPLAIAGVAVVIAGGSLFAYKQATKLVSPDDRSARSTQLASSEQVRENKNAPTPAPEVADLSEQTTSTSRASDSASEPASEHASTTNTSSNSAHSPDTHEEPDESDRFQQAKGAVADLVAEYSKSTSQHSLKAKASPELRKNLEQSNGQTSEAKEGVLVAFAWAEVSREFLLTLQASEPGFHQVPGLESRLRQASGSYRILDVERRQLKDDSEAVSLSKGELSLYFEPVKIGTKEFIGGYTAQYRNAQGEIRSPASATFSIATGAGAIVTMGPSPTSPANHVVVLIMPRW